MTSRYAELMFTPPVKRLQEADGSRRSYARFDRPDFPANDRLGTREIDYLSARDSFYLASVSATGWPYVQFRGGHPGFLRSLDDRTIGFIDYPGNRQFISFGNLDADDRIAMILMDYPNRRRLKIVGRARMTEEENQLALLANPGDARGTDARRAVIVSVEAFDWAIW